MWACFNHADELMSCVEEIFGSGQAPPPQSSTGRACAEETCPIVDDDGWAAAISAAAAASSSLSAQAELTISVRLLSGRLLWGPGKLAANTKLERLEQSLDVQGFARFALGGDELSHHATLAEAGVPDGAELSCVVMPVTAENWRCLMPIDPEIKAAIASGDVEGTRRLVEAAGAKKAGGRERTASGGQAADFLELLEDMSEAYLHFAILAGEQAVPVALLLVDLCRRSLRTYLSSSRVNRHRTKVSEGGTPLHLAVSLSQHAIVERILSLQGHAHVHDRSVHAEHASRQPGVTLSQVTPLGIAIGRDDARMMGTLLRAGARPNSQPCCREVGIAFECGSRACVEELIRRGMLTPAHVADEDMAKLVQTNDAELVSLVCGSGAAACVGAMTMHLVCFARTEVLEAVLAATQGNWVNVVYQTKTPLITVAYHLTDETDACGKVRALLHWGADTAIKRLDDTAGGCGVDSVRDAGSYAAARGFAALAALLER